MQPSKEQIENAARLVPEHVFISGLGVAYVRANFKDHGSVTRDWQPWADTEAGSHDWAVLDTAVKKWYVENAKALNSHDSVWVDAWRQFNNAESSGDLKQRKAATFAAASAIGAHMKGVGL